MNGAAASIVRDFGHSHRVPRSIGSRNTPTQNLLRKVPNWLGSWQVVVTTHGRINQ
ncbi:hypothetical protein PAHAL_5G426600 [Panicum hallii]|uniref:Uncharacterized protein n=1 Tax=Panicum hallii TaxID=206008 RepID=A0A2T8IN06_9POAL|nr:hypothetical protein PAHAL_5G426600 [Panicum hallii]